MGRRILISNDDGIFAEGIRSLALTAGSAGHQVTVVCPDQERSATGHGLTVQHPIRAERADQLFGEGITAWACSGTPSDCVKLGLGKLLDDPPDLVLAGINHGPNLGTDVFYSGTVSTAMEGALEGLPAMAVSCNSYRWRDFGPGARFALALAEQVLQQGWPEGLLLNVNVPARVEGELQGHNWCRPAVRRYVNQFDTRTDPRGKTYYWLAGEVIIDAETASDGPEEWETDLACVERGAIAVTPLQPELFWRRGLDQLPQLRLA